MSGSVTWAPTRIAFGGDWNPEQWPEEEWAEQIDALAAAGVDTVRLAVFGWSQLQPAPDSWDFDWLDRATGLLHERGMGLVLATATASPPPWFSRLHPESRVIDERGVVREIGSRQTWCPSSIAFRAASLELVTRVAHRYGSHPALRLWHTNNELGCHNSECFCEASSESFRRWLANRYGPIAELNAAWGTAFWSQRYGDFDQVAAPAMSTSFVNPAQVLDWRRFCSEELLAQHVAERDLIRAIAPGVPITTNFMVGTGNSVGRSDYFRWAASVDVVSNDHYEVGWGRPDATLQEQRAWSGDFIRGVSARRPWYLMEHAPSGTNWQEVNRTRPPGEIRRTTLAYIARGADAACYFQLTQSPAGAERFHSALVPHAGTETRAFREMSALGADIERLGEIVGSEVVAEVAMLVDWEAAWALQHPTMPNNELEPFDVAKAAHRAFTRAGQTVDLVHPSRDLAPYRVVVVPALYLCDGDLGGRLTSFASAGGHVLVTFLSGISDLSDRVRTGGYPGAFRDLVGVRSEAFAPLPTGVSVAVSGPGTDAFRARVWQEEMVPQDGTDVLARYIEGEWHGLPALTRRTVASGSAWYLPTLPDASGFVRIASVVCDEAGLRRPPADLAVALNTAGVELVRRRGPGGDFLFALNHGESDLPLADAPGRDLLTGEAERSWTLPAGGARVIRLEADSTQRVEFADDLSSSSDSEPVRPAAQEAPDHTARPS